MDMISHEVGEMLWKELAAEEVPLHLWHDWVKLRASEENFDDIGEDEAPVEEPETDAETEKRTPRIRRKVRMVFTGARFNTLL